jgi:hypothetical protein
MWKGCAQPSVLTAVLSTLKSGLIHFYKKKNYFLMCTYSEVNTGFVLLAFVDAIT